ncbi:hypothetical protein Bca52824_001988 [Brassica carinata]|uniref:Uncharacterized protein n=1 Tax=Brassica carinata TaxID=52824 RepID=A0A8X7WML0_BRACI|nr:hypothetical protein Bca52824_001988 [Brassica carinata]
MAFGWRYVGRGESPKLGKIVAVESVFYMLDREWILRYEMGSNRWVKESSVPKLTLINRLGSLR